MTTPISAEAIYEPVLQFWFGSGSDAVEIAKRQTELWWGKSPAIDADVCERFGALRERAISGELENWEQTNRGRLALIILVDQLSRNIFRDRPEAYTYDFAAQEWCLTGLDLGADEELQPIERVFFYLPLEHSESRVDQARSVALFADLLARAPIAQQELFSTYLDFAKQHQVIVDRFDRFPHRNRILGRTSTAEEIEFLEGPGSAF
jgi:uncharacterized protein (DUF924 family)